MEISNELDAARAGNAGSFERLVAPYQRELRAHCYRMTASMTDADDALQDALLRAWKGLGGFDGRASLRTWLYRVTTNACVDFVKARKRRTLPSDLEEPSAPTAPLAAPVEEPVWLEPCPDSLWQTEVEPPDAIVSARESVQLAFLVALQELPPQQRAALLVRDVLGFSAEQAAELLEISVAAANSALQRARASVDARRERRAHATRQQAEDELLSHYVRAWDTGDAQLLAAVLHQDAVLRMPPIPNWYQGRDDIIGFFSHMFPALGSRKLVLTRANGCPAVALYVRDPESPLRAHSLHVLEVVDGAVVSVDAFLDGKHVPRFELPEVWSDS